MASCPGGYRDIIPEQGGFIQKCGIFLFHTHRAASTSDIAGEGEKLFYGHQRHIFVSGGFCGFFQIQFTAYRDAENIDSGALPTGYQRFKNLLRRKPNGCGGMKSAEILLIKLIKRFPAGNPRLLNKANSVCFFCHNITGIIIHQFPDLRKSELFGSIPVILMEKEGIPMNPKKDPEAKSQEQDQIIELGSDITKSRQGNIYTLTIIGQVEGHQVAPETVKTTKYEHVLPLLAGIEESDEIDGLLLLLNTVGGDIEAGLAIAEMIAGMKKPTVSLVLGGGHSIGIPLAVCTKKSFITPTASMTVHPVRMTGLVVGAPQTFRYFQRIQEQIADFVTANSRISREDFERYMMATGEMATDVGTILYGKEAVASGLIDKLGGLSDALAALHKMIDRNGKQTTASVKPEKK